MIKIQRIPCPACLNKPDHEFAENDYKHQDIIQALLNMQHHKCCYCERSLSEGGESEKWVDHYRPRTSFRDANGNFQWHLANRWENLLYSCPACGGAGGKGSKNPFNTATGAREIIDPSSEETDPEDHIDFDIDGLAISYIEKRNSALGRSTIDKLKLCTRIDLIRNFRRIVVEVEKFFVELINALEIDDVRGVEQRKNELSRFMSANHPFACFRRNFISKRLNKLNENDIPKLEAKHGKSFARIVIDFPTGHEVKL